MRRAWSVERAAGGTWPARLRLDADTDSTVDREVGVMLLLIQVGSQTGGLNISREHRPLLDRVAAVEEAEFDLHGVGLGATGILSGAAISVRINKETSEDVKHLLLLTSQTVEVVPPSAAERGAASPGRPPPKRTSVRRRQSSCFALEPATQDLQAVESELSSCGASVLEEGSPRHVQNAPFHRG